MAILVHVGLPDWMTDDEARDVLAPLLPGVPLYCGPPRDALADVVMFATTRIVGDPWPFLPNLRLVQKLGAGADGILADSRLPAHVRVARMASESQADDIAEYCLAYVLRRRRDMDFYDACRTARRWEPRTSRPAGETVAGVLGLGRIGARVAALFAHMGFRVLGWSRTPKSLPAVECRAGDAALPAMLGECDFVVAVLPSTPRTSGLFDAAMLARMKPGATLVNVGRGDLVDAAALIDALDRGPLGCAVLDVFPEEPLPPQSPLWAHPKAIVTPHVSGRRIDGGWEGVAENYRRLLDGRPLSGEIDREAGY